VSDASVDTDNYCYRHPDRQSFVLCQRCGRTICGECQTQAAVGVHCPECTREARQSAPRSKPVIVKTFNRARRSGGPVVTWSIIGLTALVYLLQLVSGGAVITSLAYWPPLTLIEPWRILTTMLVHSEQSFLHILFNMYSLYIFGRILEQVLGRWRFLALYLISGLGGSIAVLLLAPSISVVGASGAIFGLLGAFFVIQRRLGGNNLQLVVVIGLNLVIGFVVPGIAWQAHVGGLIAGALVALVYLKTRRPAQKNTQLLLLGALVLLLVVVAAIGYATLPYRYF
jgi:membrane associated rhomboid family serine protease